MATATPKALATREKILQAADKLFYLHGYNATGLDRIIREAGITKGNFYYHFKSKEALATAALERHFEITSREMVKGVMGDGQSPLTALFSILDLLALRQTEQYQAGHICGCYFGNFTLEMSTESKAVRRKVQSIFDRYRAMFRDLLERAAEAGEIAAYVKPGEASGVILSLMEGAILLDKAQQHPGAVSSAVKFIKQYVVK
ncbi:MAG: TetR/AcrR family transcriptional regulator [Gammaproteobacteria bacterium]|nr:TetR/AcrR family transcriptional regulator [Gammaproteobacteria bacterium]